MRRSGPLFPAEFLRRLCAAGAAALVLALTLLAASPAAHDWLHVAGDEHRHCSSGEHERNESNAEDRCAVVMFASGVSVPVAPLAITPPTMVQQAVSPVTAADVFLVSPRYLRQPERGPPVG